MTLLEIENFCALFGCTVREQNIEEKFVKYFITTHDGIEVISWSFQTRTLQWYIDNLPLVIQAARDRHAKES